MPKEKVPASLKPRTTAKEFDVEAIELGRERCAMASMVIRLGDSFRDDWFPGQSTFDALQLALIMLRMFQFHLTTGRAESSSALSRATGMPRATLRRKLAVLKRMGFVKQHGVRFVLDVEGLNQQRLLDGFKRRLVMVRRGPLTNKRLEADKKMAIVGDWICSRVDPKSLTPQLQARSYTNERVRL